MKFGVNNLPILAFPSIPPRPIIFILKEQNMNLDKGQKSLSFAQKLADLIKKIKLTRIKV